MRQGILGEAASAHQPLPPHQLNQLRTSFLSTVASPARHENARQEKQDRSRTHATHATPRNATPRHATHATHATQAMPRFDAHHTGSLITSCVMGQMNFAGVGIAARTCDRSRLGSAPCVWIQRRSASWSMASDGAAKPIGWRETILWLAPLGQGGQRSREIRDALQSTALRHATPRPPRHAQAHHKSMHTQTTNIAQHTTHTVFHHQYSQ